MIIELDKSIAENLELLNADELAALSSLAISRIRGFNFFIGHKPDLVKLSRFQSLGIATMEAFKKIFHDQTKWANALKGFDFRVRLVKNYVDLHEIIEGDVRIVVISLSQCLRYKIDDKPSLIAENLTDISFYTKIVQSYLKNLKFASVNFSYNAVNGGGATTKDVVENHYLNQNGISLCILDSDLEVPWGGYGNTAQDVINLIPNEPYARHIITYSREAENIIPTKILDSFGENNKTFRLKVQKFKDLSSIIINDHRPIKYVDFKKGIKKHLTKTACFETNDFWNLSFIEAGILKKCNAQQPCMNIKNCRCILADGLGSDLLKSSVDYLQKNDFSYSDIDDYMRDEWDFICKSISPYIIAPSKSAG